MMRIDIDTMRRTLRKPLVRGAFAVAGVVVAGAVGLVAQESRSGAVPTPDKAACCSSALAIGDSMMTPSVGADKDFFEVPSSPPSAIFLVGNNESMLDFPEYLPEVFTPGHYPAKTNPSNGQFGQDSLYGHFINTGCSDPALVAAMSWFDKDSTDPAKNGSVVYDADSDFGATPFFQKDRFYHARGRRLAWEVEDFPASLSAATSTLSSVSDVQSACYQLTNWKTSEGWWNSEVMKECEQCLATKGWWRGPIITAKTDATFNDDDYPPNRKLSMTGQEPPPPEAYRKWIVNGRLLNVRPPKFVVARKVLKDVINMAPNVRMGVATFGKDHGWFDPPEMMATLRPSCDLSFPTINEAALNRPALRKAVNDIQFRNYERSIGEALFGLGGYFSSQRKDNKWTGWFNQPLNPGGFGWPGCCNGGTLDNADTGQEGFTYAAASDEWLKPPKTVGSVYLPGQPFEGYDPQDRSVCFGCQVNSVIVLTDGAPKYDNSVPITKMMDLLVAKGAKHPDGTPLVWNPSDPANNPNVGGVNYCDQFEKSPGVKYTKADCDYGMAEHNWPTGLGVGNKNFMDDVAFFMANTDLRDDMPGTQSMRTYTIGYGDNSAMLQSISLAGKGKFYRANNATELRDSIINALGDIRQLSTSFATANISGVQTAGMQSSVYVPRFIPRRGRPYEGHLYRFFYFSEFGQGCDAALAKGTAFHQPDLNDDGDCDDSFFVENYGVAPGGIVDPRQFRAQHIVQENAEGVWVRVNSASRNSEGKLEGGTPANAFWNAGDTIGNRKAALKCDPSDPLNANGGRCILTLVDKNNDGKFDQFDNPPIEFHEDNLGVLKRYLLAGGDTLCVTLFAKQKKSWTGTPAQQDDCATQIIRFVRGLDVFDYDGDSILDEERPCADNKKPEDTKSCKLADIFHSTPVAVDPPAEPFLCTLGLTGQCVSTLYEDFSHSVTSEPKCASGGGGKPCYAPTPMDPPRSSTYRYGAYDAYREETGKRARIVLVGSNGGMLHAIHAGNYKTPSTDPNAPKKGLADPYDVGTGQEMWAFIPPDLLPKLGMLVNGHEYFVDGTPMVRDIWADGALQGTPADPKRDGTKQKDEFRTLAVITERGGGQRYLALDVTDPYMMLAGLKDSAATAKPFRWMFPNACDPESARMGQSWSSFAPKPPPIGPVRLEATTGSDTARGWQERWVTVLNGGFSPDLSRGRGVYMVDAWSGELLWSAEAHPTVSAPTAYQQVLNQMMPVAASPALVDIGKAENVQIDLDGFFDTLVVGDLGGQVWTFRFKEPGQLDTNGRVANWFGARSLEMQREDGSTAGPVNLHQKAPFYHVASNVLQPETGWLRSFMGTGDRQHMRTTPGTDCGPDDLLACIRLKCDVAVEFVADVNGQKRTSSLHYKGGVLQKNEESRSGILDSACTGSRMELKELSIACPASALGDNTYPAPWTTDAKRTFTTQSWCTMSGGAWTCDRVNLNTSEHPDMKLSDADKQVVANNRYFGFHSYGGVKRNFADAAGAVAFDGLRVTDKQGVSCGTGVACSLVDVTIPDSAYEYLPPNASGFKQRYLPTAKLAGLKRAHPEGPGWFIRYNNSLSERTAAGSTVLAGVVFWPSFAPATGVGAAACSLSGSGDMSYSWQADVITGLPDMASGFQVGLGYIDSKGRGTTAPPGEGSPIISLSATGGIRYEVAVTSPGDAPMTEKLRDQRNVTPDIYWMEVPRNLHECRHENAEACAEP